MTIHIHDGNWEQYARAALNTPGLCGALPRNSILGQLEGVRPYADIIQLIPESEWPARMEAIKGKFIRQRYESFNPVLQNQGNHPLCWAFSLAQHIECVRAKENLPYHQLAPESIAGTYNFKDQGGALDDALAYIATHGVAPRSMVPLYDLDPKTFIPGWAAKSLDVVPLERFDLGAKDMWAECVTALLSGDAIYIAYDWLSHAMNMEELQYKGTEICPWLPGTWGAGQDMLVSGSHKVPSEAYVVRQVTYSK